MAQDVTPNFKKFERQNFSLLLHQPKLTRHIHDFAESVAKYDSDPELVPWQHLHAMMNHPVVYLAERTVTGVIRREDLYSVEHPDPKIKAETEEWLWPLLPQLTSAAARAFALGALPVVFNWGRETLRIEVPTDSGETRNRNLRNHTHYMSVHDLRPNDVVLMHEGDEVTGFSQGGQVYGQDRIHLFIWDRQYGTFRGPSARRRAWRPYMASLIVDALYATYLERSVDSPRVGRAPDGTVELEDGEQLDMVDLMNELLMTLRGSGAITIPSTRTENGEYVYDVTTLDLPDRSEAWHQALSRYDNQIMLSYLALPSMTGVEEAGAQAKTLDGILKEFVQDIANWTAQEITKIVEMVHCVNHPERIKPPTIRATDVGKASARKTLIEVLRMVQDPVARRVDVAKTLDMLGVPILDQEREPEEVSNDQPGPDRDEFGDREDRRENARDEEGEESSGNEESED